MIKEKIIGASGNIKVSEDDRGNIVIDIDPTYGGQVSINTVGTIVQGNWRAEPVEAAYGGTGVQNNNATLTLNGDVTIDGPIVMKCGKLGNVNVFIPKSGTIAYAEDVLRKDNALDDIPHEIRTEAFNNISPCKRRGDLISYDGAKHVKIDALDMHNVTTDKFLNLNCITNLPSWSDLPSSYSLIENEKGAYPQRSAIWLENELTLQDDQNWNCTVIGVSDKLKQLSNYKRIGGIAYNGKDFESYIICGRNYIRCIKTALDQNKENDATKALIIELDPAYPGQETINTVGNIKKGEWSAQCIKPEFGGTGFTNKHTINLGGNIITEMPFNVIKRINSNINYNVTMVIQGPTAITLPTNGTITTQEESLQRSRNLKDVQNTQEAFRHIAPTSKRGDIIVHGYGDYHVSVPIGEPGQVLCVDLESKALVSWKHLNIESRITYIASDIINDRLAKERKAQEEAKASKQRCFEDFISIDEMMHALCIEFDSQIRSGRWRVSKTMQSVLSKWNAYINKIGISSKIERR